MGKHNNIFVAGDFIARQDIGTQILHAEHVHQESAFSHQYSDSCTSARVVEDVEFEEVGTATEKRAEAYPFVVAAKLAELDLYSLPEFEKMYRKAADDGAPVFAKFLKQYQKLSVLDFGVLNKKQIFAELLAFFPNEIRYNYRNFATYF